MPNYFSKNLKYLRENKGYSLSRLSKDLHINQSTLSRWEAENNGATVDSAIDVAKYFDISLVDLISKDLQFDNADIIDAIFDGKIPVLGTIKAGIPIEAQEDICGYIDIPNEWLKGGKKYFALKISGDSMQPKYTENDVVIFEQTKDIEKVNKKDCAVLVNNSDATFKNITINDSGITLVPLNINNSDGFVPTFYTREQILKLPIIVLGVAIEKRTKL